MEVSKRSSICKINGILQLSFESCKSKCVIKQLLWEKVPPMARLRWRQLTAVLSPLPRIVGKIVTIMSKSLGFGKCEGLI